jgi:mannose-6-phosphate isomerase-like protein (cupin superfamily)
MCLSPNLIEQVYRTWLLLSSINIVLTNGDYMRLEGFVKKGWGSELIWATNDKYCGKLLKFNTGAQFSCHFHAEKDESWYVLSGEFIIMLIDTSNATQREIYLQEGDTLHVPPLTPHQVKCVIEGVLIEVSTPDSVEDNYRVLPGDSQKS